MLWWTAAIADNNFLFIYCVSTDPSIVDQIVQEALSLLSRQVGSHHRCTGRIISILLSQNRITEAITLGCKLLDSKSSKIQPIGYHFKGEIGPLPNANVVHAKRQNSGGDFVRAAVNHLAGKSCFSNLSKNSQLLRSLHCFLERWDPQFFKLLSSINGQGLEIFEMRFDGYERDDQSYNWLLCSCNRVTITRRPSWISSDVIEKRGNAFNDRQGMPV